MASASVRVGAAPLLRRAAWARPEWPLAALAVAAWVALAWHAAGGHAAAPAMHHGHVEGHAPLAAPGLGWWVVMAVAMMLPAALPVARAVGFNSLWARRHRAPALFAAAYVAVWAAFGAAALAAWPLVGDELADRGVTGAAAAGALLALAAAWQLATPHRRCLKRCHRTLPLAPRGRAADRACARYGAYHAVQCVGVCWPLMLATVPGHGLLLMASLTALSSWERLAARPRRRLCAAALVVLATAVAIA
jgi:predicted metal-binding membrane protein